MYQVVSEIIGFSLEAGQTYMTQEQELIFAICGSLIGVLTVTFVDLLYRVFRHFWR